MTDRVTLEPGPAARHAWNGASDGAAPSAPRRPAGVAANLRGIDLNLFVILEALLEERSVQRAGQRLNLSQSATSHALDRLRKLFGDELLVRGAGAMEPTPRALAVVDALRRSLEQLRGVLAPPRFDPAAAQGGFTIAVETYETIVILPRMVDELRHEAPGMAISVRSGSRAEILAAVEQGQVDIAIGLLRGLPERFMTCALMSDDHVVAMRADHPLAGRPLTLADYLTAPHLLVSMSGATEDAVDAALAARDLRRRVVMRLPNGLAAVLALARSDAITTVTRGAAGIFAGVTKLAVAALPFDVPRSDFRLAWNRRLHESPAHAWLRRKLVAIAAASAVAAPPAARADQARAEGGRPAKASSSRARTASRSIGRGLG
jgi:DNA-binding transcriptional LysR family regulator